MKLRVLTMLVYAAAGLYAQAATAKSIGIGEAEKLLKSLETPAANACIGKGNVRMGGKRLLDNCDAALAELRAKRSAERKPSAGRLGVYAIVESGMHLAHAMAQTKLHGRLSPEACADFQTHVRTLEAIDVYSLGEELGAMVDEDIQKGLKPLRACRANAAAPYVPDHTERSLGAAVNDSAVLLVELSKDPQVLPCLDYMKAANWEIGELTRRCETAMGRLGYRRDHEPPMSTATRSTYLQAEVNVLIREHNGFNDKRMLDSFKACEVLEESYSKLIEIDPDSIDPKLSNRAAEWMTQAERNLPICRSKYNIERSPFSVFGY